MFSKQLRSAGTHKYLRLILASLKT